MQTEDEKTEAEVAAERRRALRASLERERDGYKQRGLDDRVSQVNEQIRILDRENRSAPAEAEEREEAAPLENAAESKPRRTATRSK